MSESPTKEDAVWKAKAVGILTVVGGGVALLMAVLNIIASLGLCLTLFTGAYSLVTGILCLTSGIPLLNRGTRTARPPYTTAIMQIINILACDPINLGCGIAILVLLSDPEVKSQFLQETSMP